MDLFNYSRRETSEVNIGAVPLGGPNPYPYPVDDKYPHTRHRGLCGPRQSAL